MRGVAGLKTTFLLVIASIYLYIRYPFVKKQPNVLI